MVERNLDPEAKRRRLENEQKAAFNEDIARVRAAIDMKNSEGSSALSHCGGSSLEDSKTEDGEEQQQQQTTNTVPGNRHRRDSDDDEDGNWLKNFTSHHTRIGEDYQVMDLPLPICNRKELN
ncbi:hypothetical protein HJC23_010736 [Cyclotella cryptica]|uniref:Uncharacterized protein n=1 Tax=Cyclotella cryptica TaxID=29204 RepID=A0ABD3PVV2_9STRA|eukprot:CCRYP_011068-RA/>CCRYP_011068-RA protein AED:0.52 eAED:0.49 QI:0/-1/0/1/-1/1/1/0/121